jgi:methionyl-tRNA synthetase
MLNKLEAGEALVPSGQAIAEATVLFPKIADRRDNSRQEIVDRQKQKLAAVLAAEAAKAKDEPKAEAPATAQDEPTKTESKMEIQYDDFAKIDLRAGTILTAERVPKADKLLQLSVDMGSEVRTIVSGIAEHFDPAELPGKQVIVVANLAPRKLRGIESNGMILSAEDADGKLRLASPAVPVANGSVVK